MQRGNSSCFFMALFLLREDFLCPTLPPRARVAQVGAQLAGRGRSAAAASIPRAAAAQSLAELLPFYVFFLLL